MLVVSIILIFTVMNILVSCYMSYLTLYLAIRRCKCAVMNAYWFLIIIYFLLSIAFLLYSMMVYFKIHKGEWMMFFILTYLVGTLVFAGGSFAYTKYLTGNKCDCVDEHYKKFLHILTLVRLLMAVISLFSLLVWGIYVVLQR